jgi:NNP family nitrate/nitrite transporter-like MFS transporter
MLATPDNASETHDDSVPSFQSQLGPLLFLAAIFYLKFMSRIIIAPLMPTIEQDLNITHGEAGFLFLLVSLGYFPGLLGSGFISARLSHRKTIIISSVALGMVLVIISQCRSLWSISLGMVFLGFSTGIYLPSGMATLTSLVSARHWGKAIAVHELGPNLSFLTAPLIAETFLSWFSWRGVLIFLGVLAMMLGAAFARFGKGGNFPGEAPKFDSLRILFTNRSYWIMLFLFAMGISGTLGVYTMLPLYLVLEKGLERSRANLLIAVSRISSPGMVFLAGWGTDRLGTQTTLFGVFFLPGLTTVLLGPTEGSWLVLMIVLQPLLAASFFPAGFAALSMVVPATIRNVAVSFTIPFAYVLGGGLIPMLIGIAGDMGSFGVGIVLAGALIFLGAIFSRFLIYR